MTAIIISMVTNLVAGVALWVALPRGVVLTRARRTQRYDGQPLLDTWEVRNNGALPITIRSVTYSGSHTWNAETRTIEERELPVFEGDGKLGVSLAFDDEVDEITRFDKQVRWRGLVLRPGDTLQARVLTNCAITIRYRRSGCFGFVERRKLRIAGGV